MPASDGVTSPTVAHPYRNKSCGGLLGSRPPPLSIVTVSGRSLTDSTSAAAKTVPDSNVEIVRFGPTSGVIRDPHGWQSTVLLRSARLSNMVEGWGSRALSRLVPGTERHLKKTAAPGSGFFKQRACPLYVAVRVSAMGVVFS